ncbi:MAG: galactose-1-phosphate uridylyltransferase [Elusimicrobia bacterium RIFOXYA2_FULL_50_26]|nr:MAG: galactose-1-phosphate uridylyltransferase [Elusimicrobia bacterium RIFOXYA2_FULL_50_26]OGS22499.1 MAG: galactose-1-phosphate uridylyltransferase [Elusimicrobia bacterium RIFOXYB2_FULL_50_12]
MSELRRDPVIGRWVIISTERGKRPSEFPREPNNNTGKACPFCPGNESLTPPEILAYSEPGRARDSRDWWLRVVPNKFPALKIEGALNRQGEGMYDKMHGLGAHEVIIETPEHNKEIQDLPDKHVEDIIWAYRDRIMDLKKDIRLEYALIFKNRGAAAGATLSHSHSQLIATPIVPKRVREEVNGAKDYYEYKERCVFCDIVKQELSLNQRIVTENDDFIAITPFASRFPFELWLLPKSHDSDFEDIQKHEASNLAVMMKEVLRKLDSVLDKPPYNYVLHNSPLKESHLPHYHWHIEVIPKLANVAGFEWGSGFYINPTPPEEAAKFLRESE